MMKVCSMCQTEKPIGSFWRDRTTKDGHKYQCSVCLMAYNRRTYNTAKSVAKTLRYKYRNPEKYRECSTRGRIRVKNQILDGYGPFCVCCGETEREFLTLDHVNGGGSKHRRLMHSHAIYKQVIAEGFPDTYRILCMNCNWATRHKKVCPHKRAKAGPE